MRKIGSVSLFIVFLMVLMVTSCSQSNGVSENPAEGMQVATISGSSSSTGPTLVPTILPTSDFESMGIYMDDFSDPSSGWEIFSNDYGQATYDQGGYLVEAFKENEYFWGVAGVNYEDIRIDVDVQAVQVPTGKNDAFGVDCRVQDNGDGYGFRISSDGYVSIVKYVDSEGATLYDWTASEMVYTDGRSNHLTAICQGNHLSFMVNDVEVAEILDSTFTSGDIALSAISYETERISVVFDDLVVQELGNPYAYEIQEGYSLTITNPTQYPVCYIYVVPSNQEFWGSNYLGSSATLLPGDEITIENLYNNIVDVKVDTCENLRLFEDYEIDLSSISSLQLSEPELVKAFDFTTLTGWTNGVVDGGVISNSNSDYYSVSATKGGQLVTGTSSTTGEEVTLLADASLVKTGQNEMGIYGITCRMQSDNSGIFFAIRGDGSASIQKIVKGKLQPLSDWKTSEYIQPGIGSNYIEGDCIDSNYYMYVNGDFLGEAEDDEFSSGFTGVAVYTPADTETRADFDFVNIYQGY